MSRPAGIGICGKAGSGKTRLAEALVELVDGGVRMGFAEPVKRFVHEAFGLEKSDPGGRELLIKVGHGMRGVLPRVWIDALVHKARMAQVDQLIPIVDDLRYRNELDALKELGFFIVRVDAPPRCRAERLLERGDDPAIVTSTVPSECELDDARAEFDFNVFNAGRSDLSQFAAAVWACAIGSTVSVLPAVGDTDRQGKKS